MPSAVMGGSYSGEGGTVADVPLIDPGNTWEPNTAVAQGYRIAETVQGELRVFEAVDAGTTGDLSGFTDLTIDLTPLGLTSDDDFDWRYLGIVGQMSWEYSPLQSEFGVDEEGPYVAGHEPISEAAFIFRLLAALGDPGSQWEAETAVSINDLISAEVDGALRVFRVNGAGTTALSEPAWNIDEYGSNTSDGTASWDYLGIVGGPDYGHPVFVANTAGDADWFLDVNNGSGFRFNVADNGVGDTSLGYTEITVDGFRVVRGAAQFDIRYNPFSISTLGLPTSDPGIEGHWWRSGNDIKISTG